MNWLMQLFFYKWYKALMTKIVSFSKKKKMVY
jgi:hypothetical protein